MGIDRDAFRARVAEIAGEEDPEFEAELIESFLGELPTLVDALTTAQASGDTEVVMRSAHTLKSQAALFGAGELEAASRALEEAARSGPADQPLVDAVLAEATGVEQSLAALD